MITFDPVEYERIVNRAADADHAEAMLAKLAWAAEILWGQCDGEDVITRHAEEICREAEAYRGAHAIRPYEPPETLYDAWRREHDPGQP